MKGGEEHVNGAVGIIGGSDRQIEDLVRAAGMRPVALRPDELTSPNRQAAPPDVVLVDVRADRRLLASVGAIKRRYPATGVAIIAPALEPELMLEAMRAGVTECVAEPLTQGALETAISRVMVQRATPVEGRVFAIIGAKGGVGTTTIAANLAEALAQALNDALLIDLHVAMGDAAVFLGVEPRFSIVEALENTHRLDEAFFRSLVVHTRSGLDLLASSPSLASGSLDPQRLRTLIDFAVRYYRAVVLDVPQTDPAALDSLEAASSIFVVVNHELPTVRSAYRLVARLRQRYGSDRIALLVNRSDRTADISLTDIEKAANAKIKHVFPSDYKPALAAVNQGRLLARSNQGKLAASFHALARVLTGLEPAQTEEAGRLFGWLAPRRSE